MIHRILFKFFVIDRQLYLIYQIKIRIEAAEDQPLVIRVYWKTYECFSGTLMWLLQGFVTFLLYLSCCLMEIFRRSSKSLMVLGICKIAWFSVPVPLFENDLVSFRICILLRIHMKLPSMVLIRSQHEHSFITMCQSYRVGQWAKNLSSNIPHSCIHIVLLWKMVGRWKE